MWWVRLGIRPERIEPRRPEHNGGHERLHRTLKAEATKPMRLDLVAQQARFDEWRKEFILLFLGVVCSLDGYGAQIALG